MMTVVAILMTMAAMSIPILIVLLPVIVVMRMLGLLGSGYHGGDSTPRQGAIRLEDEIVKAQWRYDNIWKRR